MTEQEDEIGFEAIPDPRFPSHTGIAYLQLYFKMELN